MNPAVNPWLAMGLGLDNNPTVNSENANTELISSACWSLIKNLAGTYVTLTLTLTLHIWQTYVTLKTNM